MITKEDWQKVEFAWNCPNVSINFDVDGYALSMRWRKLTPLDVDMKPFVNGFHKPEWYWNGQNGKWCEEAKRFLQTHTYPLFPKSYRDLFISTWGSEKAKHKGILDRGESKLPGWKSFKAFKEHLIVNNTSITLIDITHS